MESKETQRTEGSAPLDSFQQAEKLLALDKKSTEDSLEMTKKSMANLSDAADQVILRLAGLNSLGSNQDLIELAKADPI